ncbi:MAG TPA: hypothetical protein VLA92_05195, partial [Candidatus Saccharimonadales bacterium]|nr:hypothetical protein [Candidatus Saccharimonadales bacterium]
MQTAKRVVGVIIAVAILCALLAFLVPMPDSWPDSSALFYSTLSLTFGYVALHVGAVVLFLMGLGAYKKELRRAYIIICSSIFLLALGMLQLPIISALNLWGSDWVTHGFVGMPFILTALTGYFGARSLAGLVGLKSVLCKATIVLPILAAVNALTALLPHVSTTTPESSYDLSVAVFSWGAMVYMAGAALIYQIRKHIGAHYTNAMAWLFMGLLGSSCALILATLATLLSNRNQD